MEKKNSWLSWKGQKISFAFRDYKLDVSSPDQPDFDGFVNYPKREIWVTSDAASKALAKEILFHEIAHCLLHEMDEKKINDNEKFVSQLGSNLESFCSKNLPLLQKVFKK